MASQKSIKTISGIFLALLTSLSYIVNIYIVKLAELSASSVSLTRGVLQILVFSIAIQLQKRRDTKDENKLENVANQTDSKEDNNEEEKLSWMEKRKPYFLALLYGFLAASLSFSFILGKW